MSLPNILSKTDFDKLRINDEFLLYNHKYLKVADTGFCCKHLGFVGIGENSKLDGKTISLKTAFLQY